MRITYTAIAIITVLLFAPAAFSADHTSTTPAPCNHHDNTVAPHDPAVSDHYDHPIHGHPYDHPILRWLHSVLFGHHHDHGAHGSAHPLPASNDEQTHHDSHHGHHADHPCDDHNAHPER